MLDINHNPSLLVLRWFGVIQALLLAALGGLIYWRFTPPVAAVFWGTAVVFAICYYCSPRPLQRLFCIGVQYLAWPINVVVSLIVLVVIYFGLFTVIGFCLRVCGYDPLRKNFDRSAKTYWAPRQRSTSKNTYFRQF